MFAAVVFDVYGTLYDTDSLAEACERAYPGRGEVISQTWRQKQLQYSWLRTIMKRYADFEIVTMDALRFTLRSLKLPHDRSLLKKLTDCYDTLDLFPDVTKTLDELEPARMAILSNGSSTMLRKLLSSSRVKDRFDRIISAESVRSYKPAVAVYRLGQTVLNVSKRRTLFVSANAWDIAGAKTFGFVTAWVNRKGQTFEELGSRYDYEVSSLRQLPCIVGS
jgi:2-haloacid dehalogenase